MPISFAQIPSNIKVPLYWVEVDPSMAGLPSLNLRALLVGTMNTDGTAPADIPVAIGTLAQAEAKFGIGSELARMFKAFFKNNFANEVWGGPVAEPVGASPSTGKITVTAPPTEAGTLHLYIAGQHVPVNMGMTDTAAEVAQAIVDAIMVHEDLPVTAVVNGTTASEVDLTCTFKGINGNDIRVERDYYGQIGGEIPPTGLGVTLPNDTDPDPMIANHLQGGAGTPEFDNLIANMGEEEFEYVAMPYTDSTSLMAWEEEYGFSDTGRWGWMRQHFGHVFSSKRGEYSDLIVFGQTRNSGVVSIMAFETATPTPMFELTAAYTAKAQRALSNDPARPLQTLQLNGTLPAPLHKRFVFDEINSLANNGLAIQKCWPGSGMPQIAREQTTYQLNLYGQSDDAYELVTTLATLAKLLRNQRQAITSKYPRHKLANDGTRFGPGQAIITPGIAKAELVAQYKQDEWNGLVEDTSNFKKFLLVERDPNNPNRLNVLYPPDLINQLRIFAVLAQFRLQYDRGIDVEIIGYTGLAGIAGPGGAIIGGGFA
jgi:phage tail sheath gpL-like